MFEPEPLRGCERSSELTSLLLENMLDPPARCCWSPSPEELTRDLREIFLFSVLGVVVVPVRGEVVSLTRPGVKPLMGLGPLEGVKPLNPSLTLRPSSSVRLLITELEVSCGGLSIKPQNVAERDFLESTRVR